MRFFNAAAVTLVNVDPLRIWLLIDAGVLLPTSFCASILYTSSEGDVFWLQSPCLSALQAHMPSAGTSIPRLASPNLTV
eukprot:CAMPEP_0169064890 /NCGR_PEP_ID=MMETSP1015-20121227/2094_1 /TAXON_ID=342587 /ORGANISM="Karlodinium micrum, Strain CCMP2283" /LENGTH=78 /DNA_ID=CAMNT_0009123393 /DNA_START=189 /DNA_END=424 /DNA_ORIENTATION=-